MLLLYVINSISCVKTNIETGQSYNEISGEFSLSFCHFSRISLFSGSGGILFCESSNVIASTYACSFYNCVSSISGGAIHFKVDTNGDFSLKYICAFQCAAQSSHFAFVSTSNQGINSGELLSVCKCNKTPGSTKMLTPNIMERVH